jgi:hypothetical protein
MLRYPALGKAAAMLVIGLALCVRAEHLESRTLSSAEADAALKEWWQQIAPKRKPGAINYRNREWLLKTTTWLPNEWPPSPNTVWTQYAYGLDVTLDGVAGVSAPIARLDRRAACPAPRVFTPMGRTVKSVATHPVRPHDGWHYTAADEAAILAQVLRLTAAPSDTMRIAAYYHSWRLGNAEITAQIASSHRAFIAWLDRQQLSSAVIRPR